MGNGGQRIRWTSPLATVPQVAEFSNYLFTVKYLKPATLTDYRTAIADALGSKGELLSKSLKLNGLIASFVRDKPKPKRSLLGTFAWSF